ncbi:60S ribosomal protein L10a [Camelus dromedarius]|uniref:60S ribosomal protein L10a n=1 Tax=Camelus dromedarius TaxID=9838 RepID=A0A5N4EF90_CAMDR|nr:60S ribosomal protein L10a [Camelus dromedarius]
MFRFQKRKRLYAEHRLLCAGNYVASLVCTLVSCRGVVQSRLHVKSMIKFQKKMVLYVAAAIGHVKMTDDDLVYNIHLAVNFLVSLLKKNWQNI